MFKRNNLTESNGRYYIGVEEVRSLKDKPIIVWGAGFEGELFYEYYADDLKIAYFIDKNKCCDRFKGIEVIAPEQVVDYQDTHYIIVAMIKHLETVMEDCERLGIKNVVFWDRGDDVSTRGVIEHFKSLNSDEKRRRPYKVLVSLREFHGLRMIYLGYFMEYFREKYDADIVGMYHQDGNPIYDRRDFDSFYRIPSWNSVVSAIGIDDIIKIELSELQNDKAKSIYDDLRERIHSFSDWCNIEIYGVNYGKAFTRFYLRHANLSLDPANDEVLLFLWSMIRIVVFWNDYFDAHKEVKALHLLDATQYESMISNCAISKGIDVYFGGIDSEGKARFDESCDEGFDQMHTFFESLSEDEQKMGIEMAQRTMDGVLNERIFNVDGYVYGFADKKEYKPRSLLDEKKNIRVVICPHIFEEDSLYDCGEQLFDNNYISWLVEVGNLSKQTDYEWFLKMHPHGGRREEEFFEMYLKKYDNINVIPKDVSPSSLKESGVDFALTVHGTIGTEYPFFGIQVINSGRNRRVSYGFNHNPKSKKEYIDMVLNLKNVHINIDYDEIYEFFAMTHFIFQPKDYSLKGLLFDEEYINEKTDKTFQKLYPCDTRFYKQFNELIITSDDESIRKKVNKLFLRIDSWKEDELQKKDLFNSKM